MPNWNWPLIIAIVGPIVALLGIFGTINAYILSMIRDHVKAGIETLTVAVNLKQDKAVCETKVASCTKLAEEKEETYDRDIRMLNKRLSKHKHEDDKVVFIAE